MGPTQSVFLFYGAVGATAPLKKTHTHFWFDMSNPSVFLFNGAVGATAPFKKTQTTV